MFYDYYNLASDKLKLDFLDQLLQADENLQSRFVEFYKAQNPEEGGTETGASPQQIIEEEKAGFLSDLENLNLVDIDWEFEDFNPHLPDYEAMDEIAERKVQEEFDILQDYLSNKLEQGKVDQYYLALMGTYEACLAIEFSDEGGGAVIDNEWLLQAIRQIDRNLEPVVAKNLVTKLHFARIIEGALERQYEYYPPESPSERSKGKRLILLEEESFIRFFEPMLLRIMNNREKALKLEELADKWSIPEASIPRLTLKMRELLGDTWEWEHAARELVLEDQEVAQSLLSYYENQDKSRFIEIATHIWEKARFRDSLAEYLQQNLSAPEAPELYKNLIQHLTEKHQTEEYYKALRPLLSEQEMADFQAQHQQNLPFYTMMLRIEAEYAKLLKIIRNNMDSPHFYSMISRVIDVKPKETFELIQQKVRQTLDKERGRNVYKRLSSLLERAYQVPECRKAVVKLADELYHWQPRLPALRQMLKDKGLV